MAGQVYAVASGKGGVGKTTTVVNLGVVLRRADHTVALVDADLGMANLGTVVGVEGELTLHDVLAGEAYVDDALVEEAPGFAVLTGSADLGSYSGADPRALGDVLETLAESYDFVLVDTGAGMSHEDVLPLGLADRVLLVTTPEPAAIGDTRKTAELAELVDGTVGGLVVTMADESTDAAEIAGQVGVELLGVVPYDAAVRQSTASATPLEAVAPESPPATAYRQLAESIVGQSLEESMRAPPAEETLDEDTGGPAEGDDNVADGDEAAAAAAPEPAGEPETAAPEAGEDAPPAAESVAEIEDASAEPAEAGEAADADQDDDTDVDIAAQDADAEVAPEDAEAEVATENPEADPDTGGDEPSAEDADDTESSGNEDGSETEEEGADTEGDDGETEEDDLDDYLEEFEDVEPAPSGGLFARIRRLFR